MNNNQASPVKTGRVSACLASMRAKKKLTVVVAILVLAAVIAAFFVFKPNDSGESTVVEELGTVYVEEVSYSNGLKIETPNHYRFITEHLTEEGSNYVYGKLETAPDDYPETVSVTEYRNSITALVEEAKVNSGEQDLSVGDYAEYLSRLGNNNEIKLMGFESSAAGKDYGYLVSVSYEADPVDEVTYIRRYFILVDDSDLLYRLNLGYSDSDNTDFFDQILVQLTEVK